MSKSRILVSTTLAAALVGCASQPSIDEVSEGREVLVRTESGRLVAGRLVKATDTAVVLERRDGGRTSMDREAVAAVALPDERRDESGVIRTELSNAVVAYREVTVPAGTILRATLDGPLASDTNRPEDRVEATLSNALRVDDHEILEAGATLVGTVTSARPSGKVKGRARLAFRFDTLTPADGSERLEIDTRPIVVEASGSESKDAKTIGIPAAAGAVLGGILGGGKGAAAGAAIGGGAGTAVVLTTRANEVRLAAGTPVELRLERPLTFQLRVQ